MGLTPRERIKSLLDIQDWLATQEDSALMTILLTRLIDLYDMRLPEEELIADRVWNDIAALRTKKIYQDMGGLCEKVKLPE
jgi:hypothetical protein